MNKKIIKTVLCILTFNILSSPIYADDYGRFTNKCFSELDEHYYKSLMDITNGISDDYSAVSSDPNDITEVFSAEEVKLLNTNNAVISVQYSYENAEKWLSECESDCIKGMRLDLRFFIDEKTSCKTTFNLFDNPVIKISEARKKAGVYDYESPEAITMFCNISVDMDKTGWNNYWPIVGCDYASGVEIIDLSKKGWQECDNILRWGDKESKRFYVKSDGTLAVKSTVINGTRYKFTSDGVCRGKYTGWTKSDSGRRYWKDGKLIKSKWLKTKSGKRYYADENGYLITGKRTIKGANYSFDDNGVLIAAVD